MAGLRFACRPLFLNASWAVVLKSTRPSCRWFSNSDPLFATIRTCITSKDMHDHWRPFNTLFDPSPLASVAAIVRRGPFRSLDALLLIPPSLPQQLGNSVFVGTMVCDSLDSWEAFKGATTVLRPSPAQWCAASSSDLHNTQGIHEEGTTPQRLFLPPPTALPFCPSCNRQGDACSRPVAVEAKHGSVWVTGTCCLPGVAVVHFQSPRFRMTHERRRSMGIGWAKVGEEGETILGVQEAFETLKDEHG